MDIRKTPLSSRVKLCLWRNRIKTVEELITFVDQRGVYDLEIMRGMGVKSLAEVETFLANLPAIADQPPPVRGQEAVWPYVAQDLKDRVTIGRARYGTELMTHNGRDALVDAYQEALDLVLYLRQAILERNNGRP